MGTAMQSINRILWSAAFLGCASASFALAPSTPGSPDPTFGANGAVYFNPTPGVDQAVFGAVQPDGKYVITGGFVVQGSQFAIGVVRLLDNGTPDPSFAVNGFGSYRIDSHNFGESVYVANDGKLYVVGFSTKDSVSRCAVVRLLSDGQLDASYGDGGIVRFRPGSSDPYCFRGALLADGRMLVAGSTDDNGAFVVRLNANGTIDSQFGNQQGYAVPAAPAGFVNNMTVSAAGRIALFADSRSQGTGIVVVLKADGTLDTTFNGTGFNQDPALLGDNVLDGKFLADGRLVVTGNSPAAKPAAWRFNANGTPDPTFGTGGMAERMLAPVTGGWGRSIAVQHDGKYVIGLRSLVNTTLVRFTLLRLNADGSVDTAFGNGGQTVFETGHASGDYVYGTEIGPDGKIWLSGTGYLSDTDQAYMVARAIGVETTTNVIEFFNSQLLHYFVTADPVEAAAIDAGAAGPGWARTGGTWKSGGSLRVCRFYGSIEINPATGARRGPNSHFYTIETPECAAVKLDQGWHFESYDFSGWPVTSPGACPQGTTPVYRAYNGRFAQNDSNHRYVVVAADYSTMTAQGWAGEGIVFCAVL